VGSAREGFGAVYLVDRGAAFAGRTRSHKGLPSILVGAGSGREGFGALYLVDRGVAFAGRTRSHKGGGVVCSRRGEWLAVFFAGSIDLAQCRQSNIPVKHSAQLIIPT